jgi:hypothetical protein
MKNADNENYNELAFYTLALNDECFIHQYIVDAYTTQSANSVTKSISLTFSLVGLYLFVEKNFTGKQVQKFHTLMSNHKISWPSFELPKNRGEITIEMVLMSELGDERIEMIKNWCHSIWNAFSNCHTEVKSVTEYYLKIQKEIMNY